MQVTEHFDIIIIGAGASGLLAARELTRVKLGVLILEAQDRIGGRMYTNFPEGFTAPIESGAEFVHGDAPISLELLEEADLKYTEMKGNTYQAHNDSVEKKDFFDSDWEVLLKALKTLHYDMPFSQFLDTHFKDAKYKDLRDNVKRFVEGYNAADIEKVSSMALREEWSEEEDPAQYRIKGGYTMLYDFLAAEVEINGGIIRLNQKVTEIRWTKNRVEVNVGLKKYQARKCLVTIPVSVLQTESIAFVPAIPDVISASKKIGFGPVVKINLEFRIPFWESETERKFKALQFLFTDEAIPTWWSQVPDTRPLLTGWIGGPGAERLRLTDQEIFELALQSLVNAFKHPKHKIQEHLLAWKVDQWIHNEFSMGAYSYEMVGTPQAVSVLEKPVDDTLYFCGEAIYAGPYKGTVEAALTSGRDAAKRILIHAKN
ncbi:MAG TPA: NAD(P)/FAD-dependent oxidoreductase [Chryseosolibacter sp.]